MAFKKGKSGNPGGRPKKSEEEKVVHELTKKTFNDLCEKMMSCNRAQLAEIVGRGCSYEEELFIRHMLYLGKSPDWHAYEKYLARRLGKVKDEIEHSGPDGKPIEYKDVSALTDAQVMTRIAELIKKLGSLDA